MTLEEEAKKYAEETNNFNGEYTVNLDGARAYAKGDFVSGANSKYVQAEKIKAQMSSLNRARDLDILTVYNELKQQLKELQ